MLRTLAKTMLVGAVQKGTGVVPAGPISTALITSGASLLLTRGRRPVGLALAAVGGLLLWHETEQERRREAEELLKKRLPKPDDAAAPATTPR
jgi:uncharacterized membrane protein (UPF0136 family)